MTAQATTYETRFTRDADRALIAGVCAGIARYFGFNLCVTRLIALIAFFAAMPFMLVAYLAVVFLVPASSSRDEYVVERVYCRRRRRPRMSRRERKAAEREAEIRERQQASEDLDRRARSLDERLARIEKYVTSSRYELDEEFRNL